MASINSAFENSRAETRLSRGEGEGEMELEMESIVAIFGKWNALDGK